MSGVIEVKQIRQFKTYQAAFDLYPSDSVDTDYCFKKAILCIAKWVRSRTTKIWKLTPDQQKAYSEMWEGYLTDNKTPFDTLKPVEQFDLDNVLPIKIENSVKSSYEKERNRWALCFFNETDQRIGDRAVVRDGQHITEIYVCKEEPSVALGIRISFRVAGNPHEGTIDKVQGFRPAFVKEIFEDEDIVLVESGLPKECDLWSKTLVINGKSQQECDLFAKNIFFNENRNMPILFVPEKYYYCEGGEDNESLINDQVEGLTESLMGYGYVVVWTKTVNKLFRNSLKDETLAKNPEKMVEIKETLAENAEKMAGIAENGDLVYYKNLNFICRVGFKGDDTVVINDNDYTVEEANKWDVIREYIKKASKNQNYHFGNHDFIIYPDWIINVTDEKERDIKSLSLQISELQEELDRTAEELQNKQDEVDKYEIKYGTLENLGKEIQKKQKKFNHVDSQEEKKENKESDLASQLKKALSEKERLSKQVEDLENKSKNASSEEREKWNPIFDIPRNSDGFIKKGELLKWIEEHYSEQLIIHSNAKKSFEKAVKDNTDIDYQLFCYAIHYLAGYTSLRQLGVRDAKEEAMTYCLDNRFEITGCGKETLKQYEKEYTIELYGRKILLEDHLKLQSNYDFRVYYKYVEDEKKLVIGYMLDHLSWQNES